MALVYVSHELWIGPKQRQRHHSYNENVDEPAALIDDETTEIESEQPQDENEPVERQQNENKDAPPAFEE